jgi:acetyl-CoA acyltransferase
MPTFGNGRRVAIVDGVRTPFTKAGSAFKAISAIDLGKLCVAELIQRTNLSGSEVQALVFGTVIPNVVAPNIAREVALMPLLPKGVQAFSVSRACASANQAITDAADQIALGHIDTAIAGGSESSRSATSTRQSRADRNRCRTFRFFIRREWQKRSCSRRRRRHLADG